MAIGDVDSPWKRFVGGPCAGMRVDPGGDAYVHVSRDSDIGVLGASIDDLDAGIELWENVVEELAIVERSWHYLRTPDGFMLTGTTTRQLPPVTEA